MADHYLQFSTAINDLTPAERTWLETQLDVELLEAASTYQRRCDELAALPEPEREAGFHRCRADYLNATSKASRVKLKDLVLLDQYAQNDTIGFEHRFVDDEPHGKTLWLYAEEYGCPEAVADLMQAFLKHHRPAGQLAFTWACTCSRMRIGEFSGGGVLVTAEQCHWFDAQQWVEPHAGGLTSQACRAQLASLRAATLAAVVRHLRTLPDQKLDLDDAGEAVELGEPAPDSDHAPQLRMIGLDTDGRLQASVYHPVDVNEETWDATELDEHLGAEDAARLLRAVEQTLTRKNT